MLQILRPEQVIRPDFYLIPSVPNKGKNLAWILYFYMFRFLNYFLFLHACLHTQCLWKCGGQRPKSVSFSITQNPFLLNYILVIWWVVWCGVAWYGVCAHVPLPECGSQRPPGRKHVSPTIQIPRCCSVDVCLCLCACVCTRVSLCIWGICGSQRTILKALTFHLAVNRLLRSVLQATPPLLSLPPVLRSHTYTTASGSSNVGSGNLCQAAGLLRKLFYPLRRLAALTLVWDRVSR